MARNLPIDQKNLNELRFLRDQQWAQTKKMDEIQHPKNSINPILPPKRKKYVLTSIT